MNGARDLACRRVWAALGLERAGLAVVLARESRSSCLLWSLRRVASRTSDDISLALCRQDKHSGYPLDQRRSRCAKGRRPCARTCPSVSRAARSRARPPATFVQDTLAEVPLLSGPITGASNVNVGDKCQCRVQSLYCSAFERSSSAIASCERSRRREMPTLSSDAVSRREYRAYRRSSRY
jgi:hypothetical protein